MKIIDCILQIRVSDEITVLDSFIKKVRKIIKKISYVCKNAVTKTKPILSWVVILPRYPDKVVNINYVSTGAAS